MTDKELEAIEEQTKISNRYVAIGDVLALIAEVRRLRVVAARVAMRVNSKASYDEKGYLEKWREKRSLDIEGILIEIDAETP